MTSTSTTRRDQRAPPAAPAAKRHWALRIGLFLLPFVVLATVKIALKETVKSVTRSSATDAARKVADEIQANLVVVQAAESGERTAELPAETRTAFLALTRWARSDLGQGIAIAGEPRKDAAGWTEADLVMLDSLVAARTAERDLHVSEIVAALRRQDPPAAHGLLAAGATELAASAAQASPKDR